MIEPISPDSPIEEKIHWAKNCMGAVGRTLETDPRLLLLCRELRSAIRESHAAVMGLGISGECRRCEEHRGGSCCGLGLENYYSGNLLLINLLLGMDLPTERFDRKSCFFLGPDGCRLLARDVICINYLCEEITSRFPAGGIADLREKEGTEIKILFDLNEQLLAMLRALPSPPRCRKASGRVSRPRHPTTIRERSGSAGPWASADPRTSRSYAPAWRGCILRVFSPGGNPYSWISGAQTAG